MDVEALVKIIFPIIAFLFSLVFIRKNSIKGDDRLILWLFFGYLCLSSNFQLFYREIYQVIIAIVAFKSVNAIRSSRLRFPLSIFGSFLIVIFCSYASNSILVSSVSLANIINYLSVALSSLWLIHRLIRRPDVIKIISGYLKQLIFLASPFILISYVVDGGGRVEFTFSNPNYLSFLLGLATVLILYNSINKKSAVLSTLLLFLILIFLTGSRSILLVIFPIILYYYFSTKFLYFISSSLIFLIIGFLYFDKLLEISRLGDVAEDASVIERQEIRHVVGNIFDEKPLLGVGYGNFINVFKEYVPYSVRYLSERDQIVTHNDYLRILAELGIIGMFIFLIFIVKNFYFIIKLRSNRGFLFSLVLLVLSYSFTHNNLNSFIFWVPVFMPFIYYQHYVLSKKAVRN